LYFCIAKLNSISAVTPIDILVAMTRHLNRLSPDNFDRKEDDVRIVLPNQKGRAFVRLYLRAVGALSLQPWASLPLYKNQENGIMREDLPLEEELDVREMTAKEVVRLLDEFNNSVDFLKSRISYYFSSQMVDHSALNLLFDYIRIELCNIIDKAQVFRNLNKTTLLPFVNEPFSERVRGSITFLVHVNILSDVDPRLLQAVKSVADKAFNELFVAETTFIFSEMQIEEEFKLLKERYKKSHPKMIKNYLEDIDDVKEAMWELRREYKAYNAVKIWEEKDKDIFQAMESMKRHGMTEKDLLPLIVYSLKYDSLRTRKKKDKYEMPHEKKDINEYTIEELRSIVDQVLPMIGTRTSYFFSVIKVFMWKGRIEDHNFDAGIKFLNELYPHLNFGKKEQYNIAEYDKDCFYKSFDRWKDEDAPVHKSAFKKYWSIADELLKLL